MTDDLAQIWEVYATGDLKFALRLADRTLKKDPNNGRVWELKGLIHRDRSEPAEGVTAIETASLLIPLQSAGRLALADGYAALGRRELARDLYVQFIQLAQTPTHLLLVAATALDRLNCPSQAASACREAIRRDPDLAQGYYDLGYYLARCGRPRQVTIALAHKAVSLAPDRVNYRIGLASLLWNAEQPRQAYAVVRELSPEQISRITCHCCLERVVGVFQSAQDLRRAVLCRQRLLQLELKDAESNCD